MGMGVLTDKQKRFIKEYPKDFNATRAAIRAKYSKKTAAVIGAQLLIKLKVELDEAKKKLSKQIDVEIWEIVRELRFIAFSNKEDYVDVDSETGTIRVKGWDEMPPGASQVVKSITEKRSITENASGSQSIIYSHLTNYIYI